VKQLQGQNYVLSVTVSELQEEVQNAGLKRPTYSELVSFLASDSTDGEWRYKEGSYICVNFAADLKANAAEKGWNISCVWANYDCAEGHGLDHAWNGAYLADGTWVWIEPIYDRIHEGDLSVNSVEAFLKWHFGYSWVTVTEYAIVW
jgi:hypothetical protein